MMRHLNDGVLLAYRDRQVTGSRKQSVEAHLNTCPTCQKRLETLAEDREFTTDMLSALKPNAFEQPNARQALAAFQRNDMMSKQEKRMFIKSKRAQRIAVGIASVAALTATFSLAPVRAFASDLLSIFRVEKFVIVNVEDERLDEISEAIDENLFFGEEEVLQDPGEPVHVGSVDEAAAQAGFTPRIPVGYGEPTEIVVQGPLQVRYTPDIEVLQEVFTTLGLDPTLLPDNIDGQPFTFTMPSSIGLTYYDEDTNSEFQIVQVPSPTADVPDGVNMQQLGEAMLQVLGMSPEEAANMSANIDWTSTLILPIPATTLASIQEVSVDGTTGLLMDGAWEEGSDGEASNTNSILWQKGGMVYVAADDTNSTKLLEFIESLQ